VCAIGCHSDHKRTHKRTQAPPDDPAGPARYVLYSGKKAIFPWYSPATRLPSLPIHSPCGVE